MLSRITLVCLPLLAMLAGCASSEKAHSKKDASAEGVNENAVSEDAVSEEELLTRYQRARHMLWQVSDSNSSVYLLGSVHFADPTFYPLDVYGDCPSVGTAR